MTSPISAWVKWISAAPRLVGDANQAAPLDVLEGIGGDQFGHDRQPQRFCECQQLQCAFLVGGQAVETAAEQRSQC